MARLRLEMQHPAGVRIILKKRDCVNTIALVDALGAVWLVFIPQCFAMVFFLNVTYQCQGGRMETKGKAALVQRFPYRGSDSTRGPLQRCLVERCESSDKK